jgi:hypothetical protein
MANMLFANNCNTTLSSSLTNVATTMSVTSATGFPSPTGSQYFYCTLADSATQTTIEIVKVTTVSGTTFTIVRGQDGTTGTAFASGAVVSLRLVAASLNDFPKLDEVNTFTQTQTFNAFLQSGNDYTSSAYQIGNNGSYLGRDSATGATKLYTGQDTIRFGTSGTEWMRLFNSGGVSIGNTTDPGASNLSVTGTISSGSRGISKSSMPSGSILQVINTSTSTQVSSTVTGFVSTGLTATITPLFSTSKILILVNQNGCWKTSANSSTSLDLKLIGGNTGGVVFSGALAETDSAINNSVSTSLVYLDNPGTTSATTYTTQFQSRNNTATVYVQYAGISISYITLMEIAQ